MRTKTRNTVLGGILTFVMVFAFALVLLPMTTMTAYAEREREIPAVDSGNSLNMSIDDQGFLTWDAVGGATGYRVAVKQNSMEIAHWDTANRSIFIVSELDGIKVSSGQYLIEVYPQGVVAQSKSMTYYYTSNVDQLEAPDSLQWLGNNAVWEYVDGATAYRLTLYDFSGVVFSISTNESPYDLSAYSPQEGWTFTVQALGNGTLQGKRDSKITESPAKGSRTGTTVAVNSDNSLHMSVSNGGLLTWDAVDGATGYRVYVKLNGMTEISHWDTANTYITLISEMNNIKLDSRQYLVEVYPMGVSGKDDSMLYYYTSHVDQLEAPQNLTWSGDMATWSAVDGASSYQVALYDFSGRVTIVPTTNTYYDFSGNEPQDGWTFQVQTCSNGTFSAKRNSFYVESPAKETTYSITTVAYEGNGTVSVETNKGNQGPSSSVIGTATKNTEVTVTASANPGYEFVAWRLTAPAQPESTCSTDISYTFNATSNIYIFAVFTDRFNVEYHGNGASGSMTGDVVNVGETYTLKSCDFYTPDGYQFVGWAVGSADATPLKQPGETIEVHADTIIYAVWETTNVIRVQPADTNGKIGADVKTTIGIDIAQVPDVNTEYIILEVQNGGNWETAASSKRSDWDGGLNVTSNNACTKTYRYKVYDGTEWNISETLEVEFQPLVVTFVDNQHSTTTNPINVQEYNTLITQPDIPVYSGDKFLGWHNINGWQEFDFANDRVTQDITLTAEWAGRGFYDNIPDVYAKLNAKARIDLSNVNFNNTPTYVYKYDGANWVQVENVTNYGWYDLTASAVEKTETYKIVINSNPVIESNEFTVTWTDATYTISFNKNGGSGTMDNVEYIGTYTLPLCEFDAPASKRFEGWAFSANGAVIELATIDITANTELFAIWEEIPEYMYSYYPGEAEGSPDSDIAEEGEQITLAACMFEAPDGKHFAGWAVGSVDARPLKQAGDKITINAETYIYAIWEVNAHEHTMQAHAAVQATCTQAGNSAYWYCTSCEKYFSDAEGNTEIELEATVIPATGHTPSDWIVTTPATCTAAGSKHKTCTVCGAELQVEEIPALGHDYGDWAITTPATCTEAGLRTRVCSRNENHKETEPIAALGHTWGEWQVVTPATETQEGLERRVCSRDANHVDERSIPMIGHVHSIQAVAAKAATCEAAGNTAYYECSGCHHYFSDALGENEINAEDFTIAALGHDYGEWTVTTPAQVGVAGEETRVCSRDANHKETRPIDAIPYPHREDGGVNVYEATATAGQAKDVETLFEQAKADNGKVELTVGTLVITFNADAVNAIGGNAASLTANVITSGFDIEGAQLIVEVNFTGSAFANGRATISVPFTTAVPEGKVAKVYYVNGNEKTDMNAVFADGKVTFDTNHFSRFAVVFENEQQDNPVNPQPSDPAVNPSPEKKGLSGGAIAGIVIAIVVVLAGAGVGCFFLLKKKGVIGKKNAEPKKDNDPKQDETNE